MQRTLLLAPSITVRSRSALPLHSSRRAPSISEVSALAIVVGRCLWPGLRCALHALLC